MLKVREAVIDASICCDVNALKELESYCDVLGESRSEFFHDKNVSYACGISMVCVYL